MRRNATRNPVWRPVAWAMIVAGIATTGCQVDVGGQTLPSPYYMTDDIQYFESGPEFKLSREAAALKAFSADQAATY